MAFLMDQEFDAALAESVHWILSQTNHQNLFHIHLVLFIARILRDAGGTIEDIGRLDRPALEDLIQRQKMSMRLQVGMRARAILEFVKGLPEVDTEGRWCSHLRMLPRSVLDQTPELWQYNASLAKILMDIDGSEGSALHRRWVRVADLVVAHRTRGTHSRMKKIPARVRDGVSRRLAVVIGCIRRLSNVFPAVDVASLDFAALDLDAVYVLVARMTGYQFRHPYSNCKVKNDTPRTPLDHNMFTFTGYIHAGVFPQVGTAEVLRHERLIALLGDLDLQHPDIFSANPPTLKRRSQVRIGESHEIAVRNACATAAESLIVRLLGCFGPRAGAICTIRMVDVWDSVKGVPLPTLRLTEKGSKIRSIPLDAASQELVARYVASEHPGRGTPWLFPHPHCQMMADETIVRRVLERVCKRANTPMLNPHKFRPYVVHKGLKRKRTFAEMSKFLGHESMQTTYESYFDIDTEDIAAEMEPNEEETGTTGGDKKNGVGSIGHLDSECLSMWDQDQQRLRKLEEELEKERIFRQLAVSRLKNEDLCWILQQCESQTTRDAEALSDAARTPPVSSIGGTEHPFD